MRSVVRKRSYGSVKVFWLDREEARARLAQAARRLVSACPEVDAVYLFGSLATGRAVPGSDADVLVVLTRAEGRWFDRAGRYAPYFEGVGIPVELFCYTKQEVGEVPLARRALAEGVLLASTQGGAPNAASPPL